MVFFVPLMLTFFYLPFTIHVIEFPGINKLCILIICRLIRLCFVYVKILTKDAFIFQLVVYAFEHHSN